MQTIIIYETNPWHNHDSRNLIGVASTKKNRDRMVRRFLKEYLHVKPTKEEIAEAMRQLDELGQTQCLSEHCDIEIDTEVVDTNTIVY